MTSVVPDHTDASSSIDNSATHQQEESLLLADLCEEFTRRRRAGEDVTAADFANKYPQLADQILAVFPALQILNACSETSPSVISQSEDADPESIAGYQVIRRLGSGGMGVVYEATHPRVSRRMAIKLLRSNKKHSGQLQDRFLREAEAASRLNHPNIVPFLDCGIDGDAVYLSMLFVDGTSLDHLLLERWAGKSCEASAVTHENDFIASDFQLIARMGADVAAALEHAHARGTIHRDIKPANLILDQTGKIWVTDFGLAKLCDDESDISHTGDLIGTPRYMAPEQLRGHADERSDVYSLGVTLYELASGSRAWDNANHCELLKSRSVFELPNVEEINTSIPDTLARIIMRACSHDPEDRYQTAGELQHVLNQFAHGEVVCDRRLRPRVAEPPRHRILRIAVGSLVVTVGALAAVHLLSGSASNDRNGRTQALLPANQHHSFRSEPQKFELTEGRTFDRTVVPSMERHTGLILWWVSGGEDAELFEIDRSSGRLKLRNNASGKGPQDYDHDNQYRLTVSMRSQSAIEVVDVELTVVPR